MIGGMVPPIAIALSNTFFKNRWTDEERKNAPVNYVMGLSFITEGAIPYAKRSSASGYPFMYRWFCSSRRTFSSLWL